jgi:transposase
LDQRPSSCSARDRVPGRQVVAEIGDFQRFPRARALSAYLGLVPSENTSGDKRRLGSITKAGSTLARRLLVEAAYHYRRPPRVGGALLVATTVPSRGRSISRGTPSGACTAAGGDCAQTAASTRGSPPLPSPAN